MLDARFSQLYFGPSLNTLQLGLPAPHKQTLVFLSPRGAVVHMREIVIICVYFLHPVTFLFLAHL